MNRLSKIVILGLFLGIIWGCGSSAEEKAMKDFESKPRDASQVNSKENLQKWSTPTKAGETPQMALKMHYKNGGS